ncbi:unnamed protein product [Trichogramma brassicae]|uniref:CCHC-type domain-containing protein n=1 Tax=Trichogramma brassicae TaxID=86971 RepID=A0A6H5IWY1_9HYME|nr:unnamed protein product [Trichogramma brassicae]
MGLPATTPAAVPVPATASTAAASASTSLAVVPVSTAATATTSATGPGSTATTTAAISSVGGHGGGQEPQSGSAHKSGVLTQPDIGGCGSPSRSVRGENFGGLEPVAFVSGLHPPRGACFNCHESGHGRQQCRRRPMRVFCTNCGRGGVKVHACPRCGKAWRKSQRNWHTKKKGQKARLHSVVQKIRRIEPADSRRTNRRRRDRRGRPGPWIRVASCRSHLHHGERRRPRRRKRATLRQARPAGLLDRRLPLQALQPVVHGCCHAPSVFTPQCEASTHTNTRSSHRQLSTRENTEQSKKHYYSCTRAATELHTHVPTRRVKLHTWRSHRHFGTTYDRTRN